MLLPATVSGIPGAMLKFQVVLTNIQGALAGASFRLDYPTDALRLVDDSSRAAGSLVPAGAATLWNVAPAQNNYELQSGRLSFAASSATAWPEANGVLAELSFQVQTGVLSQPVWPVRLSAVELTADGFENRLLADVEASVRGGGVPPRPTIDVSQCGMTPTGFTLVFRAAAGLTYVVEWSADLEVWSVLRSAVGTGGLVGVVDAGALANPRRYYRIRVE